MDKTSFYEIIFFQVHKDLYEMRVGNILNILITVLAGYLLFNELSTFLIIKPTLISLEQSSLKKEYVPLILVCPEPAFNLVALENSDFKDSWLLWTGNTNGTLLFGVERKFESDEASF